ADDGYAHPERVARGRVSVVRPGVQADVDLTVLTQVLLARQARNEDQPLRRDAVLRERAAQSIARAVREEHQPRCRNGLQDLRPGFDYRRADLRGTVGRSEGDMPRRRHGKPPSLL